MYAAHLLDRANPPTIPGQRADDARVYATARIQPSTFNAEARTLDVCFTTGAEVLRFDYGDWDYYYEGLLVEENTSPEDENSRGCDLTRLNAGASVLNTHYQYDLRDVIGVVEKAWIEDGKGYATIRLSDAASDADIVRKIETGIIRNISVGYLITGWEITRQEGQPDRRMAVRWQPTEISFVPVPADAGCQARAAEFYAARTAARMEEVADPIGRSEEQNTMTDTTTTQPVDDTAARTAAAQAESNRQKAIRELARRHNVGHEDADRFLDDSTQTVDAFRAFVLDNMSEASRHNDEADAQSRNAPRPGGTGARTTNELSPAERNHLMADALVASARGTAPRDERANQFIEASRDGHFSFTELARQCAELRGIRGTSPIMLINQFAGERAAMGYHTSGDYAGVTGLAMGMVATTSYADLAQDATFEQFGTRRLVNDFKPVRAGTFGSFTELKHIPENGELKGLDMAMQVTQGQIQKYGGIWGLTLEAMYNDDSGELLQQGRNLAASARRDENNKAIEQLENGKLVIEDAKNPLVHTTVDMWDGSNTVTDTTLFGALGKARQALRKQTFPNAPDQPLNLQGSVLLVSGDLEDDAALISRAVFNASTQEGNPNVTADGRPKYRTIVDSRLEEGTAYLFASLAEAQVFMYLKLRGMEGVQIWQIPDAQRLGLSWGVMNPIAFMFNQRWGVVRIIVNK